MSSIESQFGPPLPGPENGHPWIVSASEAPVRLGGRNSENGAVGDVQEAVGHAAQKQARDLRLATRSSHD